MVCGVIVWLRHSGGECVTGHSIGTGGGGAWVRRVVRMLSGCGTVVTSVLPIEADIVRGLTATTAVDRGACCDYF